MDANRAADPIWGYVRRRGISLRWLADATGTNRSFVRQMACGLRRPPADFKRKAAEALGLPEGSLFCAATSTAEVAVPA